MTYKLTIKVETKDLEMQIALDDVDREKLCESNPAIAAVFNVFDDYAPKTEAVEPKLRRIRAQAGRGAHPRNPIPSKG